MCFFTRADTFLGLSNAGNAPPILEASMRQANNSMPSSRLHEENLILSTSTKESYVPATPSQGETEWDHERAADGPTKSILEVTMSKPGNESSSIPSINIEDCKTNDAIQMIHDGPYNGRLLFCMNSSSWVVDFLVAVWQSQYNHAKRNVLWKWCVVDICGWEKCKLIVLMLRC